MKRAEAAADRWKREAEECRRASAQSEAAVKKLEGDLVRLSRELNEADQHNRCALCTDICPSPRHVSDGFENASLAEELQLAGN